MKQFFTFVRKEFYHVFRDSKTMLMLFGLPIAQIMLFGFALSNEIKNSKFVVCDFSKDEATRQLTERISASKYFDLTGNLNSVKDVEASFKAGNVKMAIVFPPDFESDLIHHNKTQIQLITDASDPNLATTLTNYAGFIIHDFQKDYLKQSDLPYQINIETRMLYNPELRGATNFVPGVMALVLMLVCVLMTSVSIVREKEKGTMEVLLVSPFNPFLVIISKAVPYFILSIINLIVILLLSVFVLNMPFNGNIFLFFGVSSIFILTCLSIGLMISNSTASEQMAMLISLMGMLIPTLLLAGFMFPIENMPMPLQVISNIVPARWYYSIVKSIMIKGLGIAAIWKETLILTGMMLFCLVVSFRKFKIRLA